VKNQVDKHLHLYMLDMCAISLSTPITFETSPSKVQNFSN
jgi:hypothetical protein